MDTDGYDRFSGHEQLNSPLELKSLIYRGRRCTLPFVLYGILLFLLLILLLITGLQFSQLHQEVADIKLLLASINLSLAEPLSKLGETEGHIQEKYPTHHKHTAPPQGPCDEDWVFFQGSCYRLSPDILNWHQAQNKCEELGAHLVVINNADEQDFVADIINGRSYWIGLVERGAEGLWSWVDGTDFLTTPHFWDDGQPDEWTERVNGEDCGQYHINAYARPRWNDADCSLRHHYACELEGK